MAFAEILFPIEISLESGGGPRWQTSVTILDSGHEKRNRNRSQDLGEWDVGSYLRTIAHVETLVHFFNARGGRAEGFLFCDPFDYKLVNQTIGTGDGSETDFQLIKSYTSGTTYNKTILKPKPGDMAIYKNGTLQIEGSDYTLSDTAGLVVFTVAPTPGEIVMARGSFYKPARFDVDYLNISYRDLQQGTVRVPIVELRVA